jgi:lysosomal Pro-X carboxypeptidase
MLENIFQALNVYYNYSGQVKCLNMSEIATSSLGSQGWSYQVSMYGFPKQNLLLLT